ncbi:unnamed protein product [Caenorhabditis auriculariae]|uniref:Uncharacterized protein n=1 Tax=Caenorhabditis auriculariae TaxID=2777116 RepID=A0A8S1GYX6_9PELO|nr:unnamed protein product [Caenorhabditis auriculariae]
MTIGISITCFYLLTYSNSSGSESKASPYLNRVFRGLLVLPFLGTSSISFFAQPRGFRFSHPRAIFIVFVFLRRDFCTRFICICCVSVALSGYVPLMAPNHTISDFSNPQMMLEEDDIAPVVQRRKRVTRRRSRRCGPLTTVDEKQKCLSPPNSDDDQVRGCVPYNYASAWGQLELEQNNYGTTAGLLKVIHRIPALETDFCVQVTITAKYSDLLLPG